LACAAGSDRLKPLVIAAGLALAALPAMADAPGRVVSMNLCTDQLAMMLAAPGQLISVSDIATDPLASPMADIAADYPANHGGAEQIYLLAPDLVVAGIYSDPATVSMLERLGIRVEQIDIVRSLSDIPDRLAQMGALLGQEDTAQALIARFEADLAALTAPADGPRAAFYYPNGYTLGTGTLSHEIVTRAGFRHIAAELGRDSSGNLALELLVTAAPDLIIGATPYPGASRSEDILRHPALQSLIAAGQGHVSGPDWVCGTPHIIDALRDLAATRNAMAGR
jgi:iron complex transport system substrate-binding protein